MQIRLTKCWDEDEGDNYAHAKNHRTHSHDCGRCRDAVAAASMEFHTDHGHGTLRRRTVSPTKRLAFLAPLAAMFLSDLVLGLHRQLPIVYVTFAAIVCLGFLQRERKIGFGTLGVTLLGSVLFFVHDQLRRLGVRRHVSKNRSGLGRVLHCRHSRFSETRHWAICFTTAVLFGGPRTRGIQVRAPARIRHGETQCKVVS